MLALLCAVLWGGLAVAIRYTQDDLPPIGTAGLRFALASAVLVGWARWQHAPLAVQPGQGRAVIVLGLLLFAQIALFHWGLTRTNSAHGSVLIGANPLFVATIAHFVLPGDRLSLSKLLGLSVATAGLVTVVAGEQARWTSAGASADPATLAGDAIVLASSLLLGIKTVYTKHVLARTEVVKLLVWSNLLATAMFLAYSLVFEGPERYRFTPAAVGGLLYQGLVVAGFCFTAWTYLLRHHRASQLAVFGFGQPLFGILFGVWLRGDAFSVWLGVGALAVAAGVYLVTRSEGLELGT
ncbi:MAG: DMT family transporter [Pirellulales bacterium]